MLNIIPGFVSDRLKKGELRGSLRGSTVLVDISGFTALTESLLSHGKSGAEILSSIINSVFNPAIRNIHRHGGFISAFAGDSFCVILPGAGIREAKSLAGIIEKTISEHSEHSTRYGDFRINVRFSLGEGRIEWGIPGSSMGRTWYFKGDAIGSAMDYVPHREEHSSLQKVSKLNVYSRPRTAPTAASLMVPGQILSMKPGGEFRDVVPVFISFEEPDSWDSLNDFVTLVIDSAGDFGGYTAGLYFEDKGPLLFVLFGAPVSFENNASRAVAFTLAVNKRSMIQCRAGIAGGIAYAGFVGNRSRCTYTALGDTINIAARLAMKADWGRVLISDPVRRSVENEFLCTGRGSLSLKGKSVRVKTSSVDRRIDPDRETLYRETMFGREKELKALTDSLACIGESPSFGGVIYVYGDPGSGKSLLISKAVSGFTERYRVLQMETDDVLGKSLNPFLYALRNLFGQKPGQSQQEGEKEFLDRFDLLLGQLRETGLDAALSAVSELLRTRSVLGALLGHFREDSLFQQLSPKARFENTVIAVKELIKGLSLSEPTVILLEDLQWLDADSRKVFSSLTRNVSGFPFILIVSSRFGDDGSKLTLDLDTDVKSRSITLSLLGRNAVIDISREMLGGEPGDQLSEFLSEHCGSNPFYVKQFCLYLRENGMIDVRAGKACLSAAPSEIPSSVKAILIARLDRLSIKMKSLVQTASVLGREFNILILSRMLKGEDPGVQVDSSELSSIWAPLNEILYIFRHGLMRDAAYDMQLGRRLKKLHLLAAEAFEGLYRNEPELLADIAYHYESAGVVSKAVEYLKKSALYAADSYRNHQALDLYLRLLALLESDSPEHAEVSMEVIYLHRRLGNWTEAISMLTALLETAGRMGFLKIRLRSLNELGSLLAIRGEIEKASSLLKESIRETERAGETGLGIDALDKLGSLHIDRADHEEGTALLRRALSLSRSLGDSQREADIYGSIARSFTYQGKYRESLEAFEKSVELQQQAGGEYNAMASRYNLGVLNYLVGEREAALQIWEKTLELARERGDIRSIALAIGSIGSYHADHGDDSRALAAQLEKLNMARELDDKVMMLYALGNIGLLHSFEGLYDKALACYNEYVDIARSIDARSELCRILGCLGNIYAKLWDFERAEKYYAEQLILAEEISEGVNSISALRNRALLETEKGQTEEAQESLREALRVSEEIESSVEVATCRGLIADLESFLENHQTARNNAQEGLKILRDVEDPPKLAEMLARLAIICYNAGELDEAEKYALEAAETARSSMNRSALWNAEIIRAKVLIPVNPGKAVSILDGLQNDLGDLDRKAERLAVYFAATGKRKYRDEAVAIYEDLINRTGSVTLKKKLALLAVEPDFKTRREGK